MLGESAINVFRAGAVRENPWSNGGKTDLIEKPAAGTVRSDFGIYGRYVLEPEIFACLATIAREASGEIQITDALSLYRRMGGAIHALEFEGDHYDTGDKLGYVQATVAFALKRPEIAPQLCAYLRGVAAPGGADKCAALLEH